MQYTADGLRSACCAAFLFAVAAITCAPAIAAAPDDAQQLVQWVKATHDHRGRPFAVVDKRHARIEVFHADGRLAGASTVLLGATVGDHTVPGVGERAQHGQVRADERTTPAGRFEAEPGINTSGEHVVWVDYTNAFAIHRLRPGRSYAARKARLESPTPADHRVSLGCVIVPVAFYRQVVEQVLGHSRAVVYVLPETRSLGEAFGAL